MSCFIRIRILINNNALQKFILNSEIQVKVSGNIVFAGQS